MSSFAWMKFLESSPQRYDRGIRMLSKGRIDAVYEQIAELAAAPGRAVLDIGCGTGSVSLACAARGAHVTGIDINAGMLEVAQHKPVPPEGMVAWVELGVAEIEDRFAPASLDAVVSCLAFSELSDDERAYTLRIAYSRLKPGGQIVIADEVTARSRARRLWQGVRRLPRSALAYALTQTTTHPLPRLATALTAAGFVAIRETRLWSDTFAIANGHKPEETL